MPGLAVFKDSVTFCVNSHRVSVSSFPSEEERHRVTAQIDQDDPSDLGDGFITWMDTPWYWEAGRIIVVYVGRSTEAVHLLTAIVGEPFVRGETRPREPVPGLSC